VPVGKEVVVLVVVVQLVVVAAGEAAAVAPAAAKARPPACALCTRAINTLVFTKRRTAENDRGEEKKRNFCGSWLFAHKIKRRW
jgi:hypothetical protein